MNNGATRKNTHAATHGPYAKRARVVNIIAVTGAPLRKPQAALQCADRRACAAHVSSHKPWRTL